MYDEIKTLALQRAKYAEAIERCMPKDKSLILIGEINWLGNKKLLDNTSVACCWSTEHCNESFGVFDRLINMKIAKKKFP